MAIYYGDGSNSNTGRVIQVVGSTKTDQYNQSATSWLNIAGLNCQMTCKESASKVLMLCTAMIGGQTGNNFMIRFQTNAFNGGNGQNYDSLLVGNADGNRNQCNASDRTYGNENMNIGHHFSYFFHPNTANAFTVRSLGWGSGGLNHSDYHGNSNYYPVTASTMTLMEIAQ